MGKTFDIERSLTETGCGIFDRAGGIEVVRENIF
jgi:hypothetical protein